MDNLLKIAKGASSLLIVGLLFFCGSSVGMGAFGYSNGVFFLLWIIAYVVAAYILAWARIISMIADKKDLHQNNLNVGGKKIPYLVFYAVPCLLFIIGSPHTLNLISLLAAILIYPASYLIVPEKYKGKYNASFAEHDVVENLRIAIKKGAGIEFVRKGIITAEDAQGFIGLTEGNQGQKEIGHVLVVGPTRRGKGLHLTTNLLHTDSSAIITDIKAETLARGYREKMGRAYVLNPTGKGHQYDPLRDIGDDQQALTTAAELLLQTKQDREPIFSQRAAGAVIAAFRAAQLQGIPAIPYLAELQMKGLPNFVKQLGAIDDRFLQAKLTQFLGKPAAEINIDEISTGKSFLESAWSTMTAKLGYLFTDNVLAMFNGHDFSGSDLLSAERPTTLYLSFPEATLEANKPAFDLVVFGLMRSMLKYGDSGQERRHNVLFLADEAKRAEIPDLANLLATAAGRGITFVTYIQDVGQLKSAYQKDAESIISNSQTQVWYTPADYQSAEAISKRLGRFSYMQRSRGRSSGTSYNAQGVTFNSGTSTNYQETDRELMTPDEILKMGPDEVISFVGTHDPIKAKRVEWFKYQNLVELVNIPASPLPTLHYDPPTVFQTAPAASQGAQTQVDREQVVTPFTFAKKRKEIEEEQENMPDDFVSF